jgi:CRP/FNR family transcriptional regulator
MGVNADSDLKAALMAHATAHEVYEAGGFLFREGSKCRGVFLVTSGSIRVFLPTKSSTPLMERIATPGSVLGLPSSVTGEAYSLTAEAIQRSAVVHISRASLTKLMQSDTVSAIKLLGLLSGEVRTLRTEMARGNATLQRSGITASTR